MPSTRATMTGWSAALACAALSARRRALSANERGLVRSILATSNASSNRAIWASAKARPCVSQTDSMVVVARVVMVVVVAARVVVEAARVVMVAVVATRVVVVAAWLVQALTTSNSPASRQRVARVGTDQP